MLNEPENGIPVRQERYSNVVTDAQIQAGTQLTTSVISLINSNPNKQELKAHCGRKPILKKKKAKWQECADNYTKQKMQQSIITNNRTVTAPAPITPVKSWYATPAGIGVITFSAVALVAGSIILFKKFA